MDKSDVTLDSTALEAVFNSPHIDGRFDGKLRELAQSLGRLRPLVLLAFAPRTAGTFLRSAAIEAADGQLVRLVHAEGGRDASLYLPWLIAYFRGALTTNTAVTHVHMPAAVANRHIIDAFDLHPCVMRRSIPDCLRSLLAMLEDDPGTQLGFSFLRPQEFADMTPAARADMMIDVVGPWYAQFYAGWKTYADETPRRVLFADYDEFCESPADVLDDILTHAGIPQPFARCQAAIDQVWQQRANFRCNRGRPHRTPPHLTPAQLVRLERFVSYYRNLDDWRDLLLTPHTP